jgi:hypothetical protein
VNYRIIAFRTSLHGSSSTTKLLEETTQRGEETKQDQFWLTRIQEDFEGLNHSMNDILKILQMQVSHAML